MTAFGLLPGPLDGVKLAVDKLLEEEDEELETVNLSELGLDMEEYSRRDDVEVERRVRDDGQEAYRVVAHSDEAREMLRPSTTGIAVGLESSDEHSSDLNSSKPGTNPDNGGDNDMVDDPSELVDLSDDVNDAQADMYDKLAGFRDYLEDEFSDVQEDIDVTLREAAEVLDYMDDTMGAQLNTQLHDYETVEETVGVLESKVAGYKSSIIQHLDEEFRDTDKYAEVRRNLEAMDKRRNRFKEDMGLN